MSKREEGSQAAQRRLADLAARPATVLISGPDSTWTDSDSLLVGDKGLGTFRVTARCSATSASAFIGNSPGSSGNVNRRCPRIDLDRARAHFTLDYAGAASLIVAGGGRITQTSFGRPFVGAKDGGYGNVTIQGAGSAWTMDNALILGGEGGTPTGPGGDGYMTFATAPKSSATPAISRMGLAPIPA